MEYFYLVVLLLFKDLNTSTALQTGPLKGSDAVLKSYSRVSHRDDLIHVVLTVLLLFLFSFTPRSQANDLAVLISRMQKNADQVEKNILQSEELLAVVRRDFRAVS